MVRTTRLAIASVMGLTMLMGVPMVAHAQDSKDQITMDLEQVDVREALRAIFKSINASYSVAPEVQGVITVNLSKVPFETALQNILKQVNATYRKEGGIYQIINREEPKTGPIDDKTLPPAPNTNIRRKVYLNHADPMFVATIISASNTNFTLAPEMSTVIKTRSSGSSGGFGSGFGGSNSGPGQGGNGFGQGNNNGVGQGSGNNLGRGNTGNNGGNFGRGG